jgi:hypothetical protein
VGNGSTGVQLLSPIAADAEQVFVFQRTPVDQPRDSTASRGARGPLAAGNSRLLERGVHASPRCSSRTASWSPTRRRRAVWNPMNDQLRSDLTASACRPAATRTSSPAVPTRVLPAVPSSTTAGTNSRRQRRPRHRPNCSHHAEGHRDRRRRPVQRRRHHHGNKLRGGPVLYPAVYTGVGGSTSTTGRRTNCAPISA